MLLLFVRTGEMVINSFFNSFYMFFKKAQIATTPRVVENVGIFLSNDSPCTDERHAGGWQICLLAFCQLQIYFKFAFACCARLLYGTLSLQALLRVLKYHNE